MKKILTALLLLLFLSSSICFAETPAFDHKVLSTLDGYSYDKFEKTWSYYGAYLKEYSDATVVIGVNASGAVSTVNEVTIYAWIRDEYNKELYSVVEELMILADDHLITCSLLALDSSSATFVTPTSNEALRIIGEAKEIAFKLTFKTGSITLEPSAEDIAEFVTAATTIYTHNLVSYQTDEETLSLVESMFPITIE